MDPETASLAAVVGERVRHERLGRGWTLDRLAEAAGVSRRAVVNVEQGAANPSIGTLLRLGAALGVGLPALVAPPDRPGVEVTRSGEGALLWSGPGGGRAVLVAGSQPPDVVELWDWTLGPGDEHRSDAHTDGTRELLQVQEGVVEVEAGDEAVVLRAGDAVSFPGDVAHAYRNRGERPARFSLAVSEPGPRPSTQPTTPPAQPTTPPTTPREARP